MRAMVLILGMLVLVQACSFRVGSGAHEDSSAQAAARERYVALRAGAEASAAAEQRRRAAADAAHETQKDDSKDAPPGDSDDAAGFENAFANGAHRKAVPAAVGTYSWSNASYATGSGCEMWDSLSLSLRIDADGKAGWSAFSNADGRCSSGAVVPTHCGRSGQGWLEEADGKIRLVTHRRGSFGGGGTPSVVSLWKCGALNVRAPMDWEPDASYRSKCVRLGSEADPVIERASEIACQHSELFPELNKDGVVLSVGKDGISYVREGKPMTLKRRNPAATPVKGEK